MSSHVDSAVPLEGGVGRYDGEWSGWKGLVLVLVVVGSFLWSVYEEELVYFFLSALGVVVFGVATARFPAAFLFIPIVLTNPYTLSETGTKLHLSEFVLLVVFAAWVLRFLVVRDEYVLPREFLLPATVIIGMMCLSLVKANDIGSGVRQIVRAVEILLVLFIIIVTFGRDRTVIRSFLLLLVVGGLAASLVGLGQFITGTLTRGATRRIFGWHGGGYGALIGSTLLYCAAILMHDRDRLFRVFAWITIPFAGVALLLSQTRAWIGAFLCVVAILFLFQRMKMLRIVLAVGGAVLLATVIVVQTDVFGLVEKNLVRNAVETAFRFGSEPGKRSIRDYALLMRFQVWGAAVGYGVANPVLGIGAGNLRFSNYFTARLGAAEEGVGYVDNQYLQFFAEAGVLAAIMWVIYVFRSIRLGVRTVRITRDSALGAPAMGFLGSILIFSIGSFFWVVTPHHELFALFVIQIGLLYNIHALRQEELRGEGGKR